MEYVAQMSDLVSALIVNNLPTVLLIITVLILIALIIFIRINIKLSRLNRQYQRLMQGTDGVNIEKLLLEHIEEVRRAVHKVDDLATSVSRLDRLSRGCVQKVGVVRFNAFEDTGSDLSFAIALLDQQDNGVVLSSLYGRNENRMYAKPITNGKSPYLLSVEEQAALQKAKENFANIAGF